MDPVTTAIVAGLTAGAVSGLTDTATSLNNQGALLRDMGDLEGVRSYLERALAIREEAFGTNHPHTRTVRNNLASLGG